MSGDHEEQDGRVTGRPTHGADHRADHRADGSPEREFVPGVAARLPRKRVAAGAVIRDPAGRVLLVEPTYKPTWEIPGGVVEADESPLEACRRELREELGLEHPVGRLLVVDWLPRRGPWHDALLFLFDGGTLAPAALDGRDLPADELATACFVDAATAGERLVASTARRLEQALDALRVGDGPRYLEFGRPVDGTVPPDRA